MSGPVNSCLLRRSSRRKRLLADWWRENLKAAYRPQQESGDANYMTKRQIWKCRPTADCHFRQARLDNSSRWSPAPAPGLARGSRAGIPKRGLPTDRPIGPHQGGGHLHDGREAGVPEGQNKPAPRGDDN